MRLIDLHAHFLLPEYVAAAERAGHLRDHPGRFGFFASLPLPDVEGALVEADYAYDVLHADGVVLLSNAGGMYPGDPSWEPLWRALDARSAMVLVHPTSPPQWRQVALDRPRPMIEFPFDTARAVTDLALTGVLTRYPSIRFVVADGDLLPFLSERIDLFQRTSTVAAQLKNLSYVSGSGYCCAA